MNGDGYTDLSGGLLYFISDGADARSRGGIDVFGVDADASAPGRDAGVDAATTTRASAATAR